MSQDTTWGTAWEKIEEAQIAAKALQHSLNRGKGGREAALVQTKLDEARLWLKEVWDVAFEIPPYEG